jgi:hypothetical protein
MEMVNVSPDVLKVYVGIINVSLDMVHVLYGKIQNGKYTSLYGKVSLDMI